MRFGNPKTLFNLRINEPYFIFGKTNLRNNKPSEIMNLRNKKNLRNNATNVRIKEPYFIFGLTNLQVYKICVFGITNLRNNEPHR